MRIRQIKPGICSNDDLAEMGPNAYILFTGLWMLADSRGRFEYRPKRIKALVMPLWDEVTVKVLENIVEGLCKREMLRLYDFHNKIYGQILNWDKHQRPDPREAKSDIPAPPTASPMPAPVTADNGIPRNSMESQCGHSGILLGCLELGAGLRVSGGVVEDRGFGGKEPAGVENAPPPPHISPVVEQPETVPPQPEPGAPKIVAERKPPQRETQPRNTPAPKPVPPAPRNTSEQLPGYGTVERPRSRSGPVDFRPHSAADVQLMRDSLRALAEQLHREPPDDAIVRWLLDCAHGAGARAVHEVLVALYQRGKFSAMRTWGFLPSVIEQYFVIPAA